MKSFFVISFLFLFSFFTPIYGLELSLRERVVTSHTTVKVSDLIYENVKDSIGDITIVTLDRDSYKLKSEALLAKLLENGINDITISGKESLIYLIDDNAYKDNTDSDIDPPNTPVTFLKEYLSNLVDKEKFKIDVNITKVEPKIDLENVKSKWNWELGKFQNGLKDIVLLKKATLVIDKKKYNVTLETNVFTDVFISKKSFLDGDFFNRDNFLKKHLDISIFKDSETIVFDIDKVANSRFVKSIGTGEVLKWTNIKKIPLVVKDEELKLKIVRNNITVLINCKSMNDGYENEKIKVKLQNGREKVGLLKKENGEVYVEI